MGERIFSTRFRHIYTSRRNDFFDYELQLFGIGVSTRVTSCPNRVEGWIENTRYEHSISGPGRMVVGLEIRPHVNGIMAIVLNVGSRCLIYRISRSANNPVPWALRQLFTDQLGVMIVGVQIQHQLQALQSRYQLGAEATCTDLRNAAGVQPSFTLDRLVVHTYGKAVKKPTGSGRWDLAKLSKATIHAATVDAFLAWEMATHYYGIE